MGKQTFYGICSNCGADKGLHHYETMQCPLHGIEEIRVDELTGKYYRQKWSETKFKDAEDEKLERAARELLNALKVAKETIHALHGNTACDLYQNSPEMKTINADFFANLKDEKSQNKRNLRASGLKDIEGREIMVNDKILCIHEDENALNGFGICAGQVYFEKGVFVVKEDGWNAGFKIDNAWPYSLSWWLTEFGKCIVVNK